MVWIVQKRRIALYFTGRKRTGENAFHYLAELLRHPEELKQNPSEWMPWNYLDTLARIAAAA